MTNDQALINIGVAQAILRALLTSLVGATAADALMTGAEVTITPAGIVGDHVDVKAIYDGAPSTFVNTPANIDGLDDVVDAIVALEIGDFAAQSGDAYDALQTASPEA